LVKLQALLQLLQHLSSSQSVVVVLLAAVAQGMRTET
jgi:hypothetical protein